MRIFLTVLALGTGLFTSAALAQTAAERAACEADYKQYCPHVIPGGGRPIACLAARLDKLTPECKAVVQSHMPK